MLCIDTTPQGGIPMEHERNDRQQKQLCTGAGAATAQMHRRADIPRERKHCPSGRGGNANAAMGRHSAGMKALPKRTRRPRERTRCANQAGAANLRKQACCQSKSSARVSIVRKRMCAICAEMRRGKLADAPKHRPCGRGAPAGHRQKRRSHAPTSRGGAAPSLSGKRRTR